MTHFDEVIDELDGLIDFIADAVKDEKVEEMNAKGSTGDYYLDPDKVRLEHEKGRCADSCVLCRRDKEVTP